MVSRTHTAYTLAALAVAVCMQLVPQKYDEHYQGMQIISEDVSCLAVMHVPKCKCVRDIGDTHEYNIDIECRKDIIEVPELSNDRVIYNNFILSNTNISYLGKGSFSKISVCQIQLMHNNITDISVGAFKADDGFSKNYLAYLNLGYNRLSVLKNGTMEGLTNIQHLLLNDNVLTKLENGVFAPLRNLLILNLANNPLAMISKTHFGSAVVLTNRYIILSEGGTSASDELVNGTNVAVWRV